MAVQLDEKQAPDWIKWITDYDATRKLFIDNYRALQTLRPWVAAKHPELLAQHDAMMKKFTDQFTAIDNLQRVRDQVGNFINGLGIIGSTIQTGAKTVSDWVKGVFGLGDGEYDGLGFVPVVWVAISVGTASAALITIASLIKEAYLYSTRLNALKEAEDRGATPEQAAQIVNSVLGKPGTSVTGNSNFMGIPFNTLALAAMAVFLGPPIINAISKGRK